MRRWVTIIFFSYCLSLGTVKAQDSLIDSLKIAVSALSDDVAKVDNLVNLSKKLSGINPTQAIDYAGKAKLLAERLDYNEGLANALKYIGMGYYFQSKYLETIDYWEKSLAVFESLDDKVGVANMLSNLGAINNDQGDDIKALEFYLRSLSIAVEIEDTLRIATVLTNIGVVYAKKPETYDKALENFVRALPMIEYLKDDYAIGNVTVNIGDVYFAKDDDSTALIYYNKSLNASIGTDAMPYTLNSIGKVYAKRGDYKMALSKHEEALKLARGYDNQLDITKSLLGLGDTYRLKNQQNAALSAYKEAVAIAKESGNKHEMRDAYQGMALSYSYLGDYGNAYNYQKSLTAIKDTLFYISNQKKLDLLVSNFENEKKQGEIDLLTKDKALQEVNLQRQKFAKNAFIAGFVLLSLIAFVIYRGYRHKVKSNRLLDKQNVEIESLILNILPSEVAKELQQDGYATPKDYESATVLFTDFKGFTKISSGLLPHELIAELNSYFNEFDDIIENHNLEKIKTIGDAYMCAGGIPSVNSTHPLDAVGAGLAIQNYIREKNKLRKETGLTPWELRVGIHTGPIVAGVVGRKKYAYDIWGDAVNIASRMESNGEAGKVNISESTYLLVKDKFKCVERGKISVKGAGEKEMYFVEGPIDSHTVSSENASREFDTVK